MQDLDEVELGIFDVIKAHGPIGWYGIEMRLRVDRSKFKSHYKLPDYLADLETKGFIRTDKDGKMVAIL